MRLEYIGLSELSGSLIALEGVKDVAYDEMAEVTLENGERRYGRVILIDGDRVVLQVFEGTRGISLENASTHFTGKSMDEITAEFEGKGYGDFKMAVAEVTADALAPVQAEYGKILADKAYVDEVLKSGAERASRLANRTVNKVYRKVGLLQLDK